MRGGGMAEEEGGGGAYLVLVCSHACGLGSNHVIATQPCPLKLVVRSKQHGPGSR